MKNLLLTLLFSFCVAISYAQRDPAPSGGSTANFGGYVRIVGTDTIRSVYQPGFGWMDLAGRSFVLKHSAAVKPTNGLQLIGDSIGFGGPLTQDVNINAKLHGFSVADEDSNTAGLNIFPGTNAQINIYAQPFDGSTQSFLGIRSFGTVIGFGNNFTHSLNQISINGSQGIIVETDDNNGLSYQVHPDFSISDLQIPDRKYVDSIRTNPGTVTGNVTFDPAGAPQQTAVKLNHGSYIDLYDVTNTTYARFAQQSGEIWFQNSGSSNLVALKNGQLYERDSMGGEVPYITSAALPDTTLIANKVGSADMVQHSYKSYTQTVFNPTGQAYTKYINGMGSTLSYGIIGMQSMQEFNYSWNFIYDKTGFVGRHQYIDTAYGEFHWALGGQFARLQYTPKGAPNTGINTLTITNYGTGYTPGNYDLITVNSTRTPATNERYAIVVGPGGSITSCTSDAVGAGYQVGDVVTVPSLPGGTGFSTTVATLATDNWGYFGKKIGFQVDNVTGTVQLGWNGNLTPAANSGLVQIGPRSTVFLQNQLNGPTNGSGFVIGGGNVGSNEAIYLNPYDLGNVFIAGGGGNATFGSNGTPTSGFGVFNSTTASSGSAWAMRFRPTAIASANNDMLYGSIFDAIYTDGAFTGVGHVSARFNTAPIQFQTISAPTNPFEGMMLHTGTAWEVYTNSTFYRLALQTNVTASANQILLANSTGQWAPSTGLSSGFTGVTPGSNANSTIIPTEAWTNTYFGALAANNSWAGTNTFGAITMGGVVKLKGYTVATLPTASTNAGAEAYVSDASSPVYGTTVAGSGSTTTHVFSNGTNWICN